MPRQSPYSGLANLEQVSNVELVSYKSPLFTNFFKQYEFRQKLDNPILMLELLQKTEKFHGMEAHTLQNMVAKSTWNKSKKQTSHEFSHTVYLECKTLDKNPKNAMRRKEDKKQLGILLSIPLSPNQYFSKCLMRKRSLSNMLFSEDLDGPSLLLSYTSSESDLEVGRRVDVLDKEEPHFREATSQSRPKVQKIERLIACRIHKELLSLRPPDSNSSLNSETSSSSIECGASLQIDFDTCIPFKSYESSCTFENDDAESPMLNSTTMYSISPKFEEHAKEHKAFKIGHDHAQYNTSKHSPMEFTSPIIDEMDEPATQLSLQLNSLRPRHTICDIEKAKFHSIINSELEGVDLCQHNLILHDLDANLETHGLNLVHLLLKCADAIAKQNVQLAAKILGKLHQGTSLYGDSMQRVVAYFTKGLAARIVSKESHLYSTLMIQPLIEEYFSTFTTLYKITPYFKFAHFTANQAILEAFQGHKIVHVIDLDIMQGFQWPPLIQALASRPGGPPHLRITGVGKYSNIVWETGRRLTSFAASFNISFEFYPMVEEKLENLTLYAFAPKFEEAIAVNAILQLHRLLDSTSGENLHNFMQSLCKKLNPCVVTLVEQEANHNIPCFLGRFLEALHYYTAVFDSLDASLPQQNEERVKIEEFFFAQQIGNIVVCEGNDRTERHEHFDFWQQVMEMDGFFQVPLSAHAISQAKLLLQFFPCEGYRLHQRNGSISLGWQERQLFTASAWTC